MQSVHSGDFSGANVFESLRKRSAQFRTLNEGPLSESSPTLRSTPPAALSKDVRAADSPTFMSSPEDDPSKSILNACRGVRCSPFALPMPPVSPCFALPRFRSHD